MPESGLQFAAQQHYLYNIARQITVTTTTDARVTPILGAPGLDFQTWDSTNSNPPPRAPPPPSATADICD